MSIELMTGSNLEMSKLATVATGLDGTQLNATSYNYTCPSVSPNSAVYFLVSEELSAAPKLHHA